MNIFILDENPQLAARLHCDQHTKMILESAQMLCTIAHKHGIDAPYKPTHQNHPCTLWVARSRGNYQWLIEMCTHLNREWQERYNHTRNHKSFDVIRNLAPLNGIPDMGLTPFVECMPDRFKRSTPVESYRNFYIYDKPFATWRSPASKPDWYVKDAKPG